MAMRGESDDRGAAFEDATAEAENEDEMVERGLAIYREKLKPLLEPVENGKAVAIHVPTGDYAIGRSHREASRSLREHHDRDGYVITLTIGPPTERDIDMANRFLIGSKG